MTDESASMGAAAPKPLRYRDAPPRSRRTLRIVVVVMTLIVIAGLLVVGELAARAYAEERVASEIEGRLPEGVEGNVDVRIDGVSVVLQYLTGRMEHVVLTSDDLTVQGLPVDAAIDLNGVPVDTSQPIDSATGTFAIGQAAVTTLLAQQGVVGDIELTDGGLLYTTGTEILGQQIDFSVSTRPVLEGGSIVFTAEDAQIGGAGFDFDATELLGLVAPDGLSVCVAEYLPAAVSLDAVEIVGSNAVVDLSADGLRLDESALSDTGTCN